MGMIIALTGNNSFAIKQRLDELVNKFLAEHDALALERVDAEERTPQQIVEAAQSVAFLSANKLIVLRGLSHNKAAGEKIEQILGSIPDSTDLIIYEPLTDKRTVLYKYLKSNTQLEEYKELDAMALAKWLVDETAKHKGTLSFADAKYLVERVGSNQAMLASELQKLIIYNSCVSKENINLLVEPTAQSKVFELLDAAFTGNKKKALGLYADQRAQKVEPQAILAMVAWQLRIIAIAKYAGKRSANDIAKDTGLNSYPVGKAMSLASRLSESKLKGLVEEALDIDYRSKSSKLDLDEALKNYIIAL
jgi:DNA polymerase III delta subunit